MPCDTLSRIRRQLHAARPVPQPPRLCATDPNQVWVWDNTLLPTTVSRCFLSMVVAMDLYSRMIVATVVHDTQDAEHAGHWSRGHARSRGSGRGPSSYTPATGRRCTPTPCAPSWRGSCERDVAQSPRGGQHKPHIESVFRTLKALFPELPFDTVEQAREWAEAVVRWYNTEHRYGAPHYVVTPS